MRRYLSRTFSTAVVFALASAFAVSSLAVSSSNVTLSTRINQLDTPHNAPPIAVDCGAYLARATNPASPGPALGGVKRAPLSFPQKAYRSHVKVLEDPFDEAEKLFQEAQGLAEEAVERSNALTTLNQDELEDLVEAICAADEDEREAVANSVVSRMASNVNTAWTYWHDHVQEADESLADAITRLEGVIQDPSLEEKHDKAEEYIEQAEDLREELDELYRRIDYMTKDTRGARHPVTKFLIEQGKNAHVEYQKSSSNCDVYEFTINSSLRADCIKINGTTAVVIEIKPNNSKAISAGKSRVSEYADVLNAELAKEASEVIKRLVDANDDFAEVTFFDKKGVCYTLCPDITPEGEFIEARPDWSASCF